METWKPWKPVTMKEDRSKLGAPVGLPHGLTPSSNELSIEHLHANKVAPRTAVASSSQNMAIYSFDSHS